MFQTKSEGNKITTQERHYNYSSDPFNARYE